MGFCEHGNELPRSIKSAAAVTVVVVVVLELCVLDGRINI